MTKGGGKMWFLKKKKPKPTVRINVDYFEEEGFLTVSSNRPMLNTILCDYLDLAICLLIEQNPEEVEDTNIRPPGLRRIK